MYGFRVFDETNGSCLEEALGFYRDEAAIQYGASVARGRAYEVWRGTEKIAPAEPRADRPAIPMASARG